MAGRRSVLLLSSICCYLLTVVGGDVEESNRRTHPNVLGYGPAAGSLVISRDDLVRVRASLGRVSDELHLILGVLDQHLETPPAPIHIEEDRLEGFQGGATERMPRAPPPPPPVTPAEPPGLFRYSASWVWELGCWLALAALFALDVGIVVYMQVFLENIGRKRGGSSIMTKKQASNILAGKAASAAGAGPGAPIPAPTATPLPSSSQRLSVLSQEELLAAALTEHWQKLVIGIVVAIACRLPSLLLSSDSLTNNMLVNLFIMVRILSVVMLLLENKMTLPSKEAMLPRKPPTPPGTPTHPGSMGSSSSGSSDHTSGRRVSGVG